MTEPGVRQAGGPAARLLATAFFLLALPIARLLRARAAAPWLIGENRGRPGPDNGYWLFRHCQAAGLAHVHFVAQRAALRADPLLLASRQAVAFGSWRHMWLLARAEAWLYTHTHRDVALHALRRLAPGYRARVFLQHGVTAFKRFHPVAELQAEPPACFSVVSDFERRIVASGTGLEMERLVVTGFPRHDRLVAGAPADGAPLRLLYFPTWRDWLEQDPAAQRRLLGTLSEWLADPRLGALLAQHRAELVVRLHERLTLDASTLPLSAGVRCSAAGQETVSDLLLRSQLLVTDYSSLSWDFLYLDKPVLFYMFDRTDYERERGAYVDLATPPFGRSCQDASALLDALSVALERRCRPEEHDRRARANLFAFHDRGNARRVLDATRATIERNRTQRRPSNTA